MKIAIIGATGHVGAQLTKEGLLRGHSVTAIVRHPKNLPADLPFIKKSLYDLTTSDLNEFDIVIDAFNAPDGQEEMHHTSIDHLINILSNTKVHLFVVGGAGTLFLDPEKTMKLYQSPDFPKAFFPISSNMDIGLKNLKSSKNLTWTYLSPSANFIFSDDKSSGYLVGEENLLVSPSTHESEITTAQYAVAMFDEIDNQTHTNKRFTVVSK